MTISFKQGDLFSSTDEAIINAVNCVGVMGKGVALQYKQKFPENYREYKKNCSLKKVIPGKMFVYKYKKDFFDLQKPSFIINFPTKQHWRSKSKIEFIEEGLDDLINVIKKENIKSISMPAIACGNGGLDWNIIKELIITKLTPLKEVNINIYEPKEYSPPEYLEKQRKWTPARAVLVKLFGDVQDAFGGTITHLSMQKLVYFLQNSGIDYAAPFTKSEFGPFSESLKSHFKAMNNQNYINNFQHKEHGTRSITIPADGFAQADEFLSDHESSKLKIISNIENLIQGYESPLGMELLSTIHFCSKELNTTDINPISNCIKTWSEEKTKKFQPIHIEKAIERLKQCNFLK